MADEERGRVIDARGVFEGAREAALDRELEELRPPGGFADADLLAYLEEKEAELPAGEREAFRSRVLGAARELELNV